MPNWCENVMTISGSLEELNEFARYVESDELILDFEEIIPSPAWKWEELPGIPGSFVCDQHWDFGEEGKLDWYHWCYRFWGTKWNLDGYTRKEFINGDLVYSFDTAWSPPVGIIRELARVFNNLIIKCEFAEPGCLFFGACGAIFGSYYEWDAEMTFKTHPEYWSYSCDECDHDFIHDGRVCPHCGYDENVETVSA